MSRSSSIPRWAFFWAVAIGFPASLLGIFFFLGSASTGYEVLAYIAAVLWLPTALLAFAVRRSPLAPQVSALEAVVLYCLLQFAYYYLLALLVLRFRSWQVGKHYPLGHCQKCGYNLTGNVSGKCPECGEPCKRQSENLLE